MSDKIYKCSFFDESCDGCFHGAPHDLELLDEHDFPATHCTDWHLCYRVEPGEKPIKVKCVITGTEE